MPNRPENFGDDPNERLPERPLECSDCKKPISTCYSTIVGNTTTRNCMCSDCPVLERHLFGLRNLDANGNKLNDGITDLACGNCGTTIEAIRMGALLGCSSCYEVFEEILIEELLSLEKIPPRLANAKKSESLHIGRIQGPSQEISASMRILALNDALTETLKREDYEQAALLRDQIKALTETQEMEKENENGG